MNKSRVLRTELRKALTSSASAIIPEDLEPAIREYLMQMSPLTEMVPVVEADGKTHEITRRTGINEGWFEGESATPSYGESTYERRSVEVKILRNNGKVTDFAQSVSRSFVDALAEEIEGATLGMADLFEFATMYGCSDEFDFTGDAYQMPGLYTWLLDDAGSTNVLDEDSTAAAGDTVAISDLDTMYNATVAKYRAFARDPYVWLMSQDMIDKISGLVTRIQRQVPTVEYEGGFVMATYKGVPMLPSAFCAPGSSASPSNLSASAAAGGSLSADTYYYRVAAITLYGEQIAASEVNATTTSTNATVDLSWDADANAKLYAIYRGTASGDANLDLLDIIAAKSYSNGKVSGNVTSYSDDGSQSVVSGVRPLDSGEETIWLVNLGERFGISRPVLTPENGQPIDALLRYEDIPVASDEMAFRLKSYSTIQVPQGKSCAVMRRVKAS